MADVFLCHNAADSSEVEEIARSLAKEHIEVWLDTFNLIPGERFTDKIEEALDSCTSIAIFVGQTGRGPYQNEEFDYAVNVRGTRGTRIIPVLLPGTHPDMITGLLRNRSRVQFCNSLEEIEPLRMLVAGIRGIPLPQVVLSAGGPVAAIAPTQCPYRPLTAFDVVDHAYFCGRDRLTAEAAQGVEDVASSPVRCFSIFGASGSGKSSLARAGVVWSLQQRHPGWTTVILEPGSRPHEALAERMLKLIHDQVDGLTLKQHGDAYLTDAGMLQRSIAGALGNDPGKRRILLLVDQFEEVFTVCESQAARDAFIGNLMDAAADPSGMLVLLLCLRADFYGDCAKTKLAQVPSRQQILIGPMERDELHSAIADPASRAGGGVEAGLISCLIRDCAEQPSPLPLLQIVLEKLWQKRDAHGCLTLAEYEKMSFEGAIDQHAEAVYLQLPEAQQRACKSLLLQLVEPLIDGRYTRRRVRVEALLPVTNLKDSQAVARTKLMEATLGTLAGRRARLITVRTDRATPEVEIGHEAIFRGWKRLAAWLDQDREFLAWKHRLAFAVSDWKDPKTKGTFLTGAALDRALIWIKERPDDHIGQERAFIDASARRRRMDVAVQVALAGVFTGVLVLSGWYWRQSRSALGIERQVHEASEQIKNGHPEIGMLLAYDAFRTQKSGRVREVLQQTAQSGPPLLEANQAIMDMALSADGGTIAAATGEGVVLWSRPRNGNQVLAWSSARIPAPVTLPVANQPASVLTGVALSPDGAWVAAGSQRGDVMVWEHGKLAPGAPFSAGSKINALAFATDGHLAVTTANKEVLWWNCAKGGIEKRATASAESWAVAVSPDSSTVAIGTDQGLVHFWKPEAGSWSAGLKHDEPVVTYVGYTGKGEWMGSATRGGKVYRWNPADASHVLRMGGGDQRVFSGAMDGGGLRMAAYTPQRSLIVFDSAGKIELDIAGQAAPQAKVLMDASGSFVAAGAEDGIRIYELSDEALAARARMKVRNYNVSLEDCQRVLSPAACKADLP